MADDSLRLRGSLARSMSSKVAMHRSTKLTLFGLCSLLSMTGAEGQGRGRRDGFFITPKIHKINYTEVVFSFFGIQLSLLTFDLVEK